MNKLKEWWTAFINWCSVYHLVAHLIVTLVSTIFLGARVGIAIDITKGVADNIHGENWFIEDSLCDLIGITFGAILRSWMIGTWF